MPNRESDETHQTGRPDRSERSRRGQIKNIAVPLYANVQQCARIAKAQADARALASAVSIYGAHMGVVATALTDLTSQVTNSQTCQSRQCMKVAAVRDARGCPFAACIGRPQRRRR